MLRRLLIDRPNQVWATDVTYIPMARGFMYLAAAIDWFSRKALAWRLSNNLTPDFCVEALQCLVEQLVDPPPDVQSPLLATLNESEA